MYEDNMNVTAYCNIIQNNLGLEYFARNSVFDTCVKVRPKQAGSTTGTSSTINILHDYYFL